jgi:serine/threonine protein kinase
LSGYNGGNEQSDIYSLGSFLIACLCGCSPFEYVYHLRQEAELSNLIITGDLPRLDIVGLPDAVEGLLHQAMSKNPDERFGSALLFARALQQAQLQCFGHTTALSVLGEEPLPAAYRKHRIARKSIARDIETRNRHGIPSRNRWWSVIVTAVVMTAISMLFAMYVIPRMDTERSSDTTIITIPGNLSGTTNEDGGIIAPQSAEMAELQGLIIRTT